MAVVTDSLDRRSYLAVMLASATAGCSGWGDRMATPPPEPLTRGHIVAIGRDLETTTIEPTATETPVQDALDSVADSGGRIYLPPGIVRERGPVRPHRNTGIYGYGMNVSVLQITQPDTDGIRFDRSPRASRVQLDGFELRGPGQQSSSGVAIHFCDNGTDPVSDPADFYVGRLYCWAWNNSVYRVDEGVGPFQCRHDFLRMDECDAGDERALIEWRSSYGPANWFGTIVAYPSANVSGANSVLLHQRGGELTVGDITTGTTTGQLVDTQNGRLRVGRLHYEPTGQRTVPRSLVRIGPNGATRFDDVLIDSEAVRYVYKLGEGAGDAVLSGSVSGRGTIQRNTINVSGRLDPDRSSWYFGRSSDVDVTGSSETGSLRVLGSAGQGLG
ncbi:hypothetical protein C469_12313 [Halorubrum lipolyticum DSM 21995]|uniref:Pectate lyase superfamily protein domain-containing protein n=1 Tax=Halorubrum lipolyticum DSM 21995 TaxID=1227482 RepID=M0NLP4_9EURY|nr:hypothetical protein C469_12313 [Halorubrum lipolyticum DSM 21995]